MSLPVYTNSQIINALTTNWGDDDYGDTYTWQIPTITYYFADVSYRMDANQIAMAKLAFQFWGDLVNLRIEEWHGGQEQISFAYDGRGDDFSGVTFPSVGDNHAGDHAYRHASIVINSDYDANDSSNLVYGSSGLSTYVHEIGHALGLSHPGPYNAGDNNVPDDPTYSRDTRQYSVMSYFNEGRDGNSADYGSLNGFHARASTPMVDDIMAIQAKYGANMSTRTYDTVYGFGTNVGGTEHDFYDFSINTTPIFTIWDAAGNDTIDAYRFDTFQVIDLRAGHYSDIGGLNGNIGIAYNVVIENAIGGTGGNDIYGNDGANVLVGGTSYDSLYGLGGADTLKGGDFGDLLDGGEGADRLEGGAGNDKYYVDIRDWYQPVVQNGQVTYIHRIGDLVIENANEGSSDEVISTVTYELPNNVENLTLRGSDDLAGFGNSLDNLITGNSGRNHLTGGGGSDTLDGGTGADTMAGGAGDDLYYVDVASRTRIIGNQVVTTPGDVIVENADEGHDHVFSTVTYTLGANIEDLNLLYDANLNGTGNAGDNALQGNTGANHLYGLGGNDYLDGLDGANTLEGGADNDTYIVRSSNDIVIELAGEGIDLVYAQVSYTLTANVEDLTLRDPSSGSPNYNGTGNDLDNILTGNSGRNTLTGGGGSDTLDGGLGADTMIGGDGDDVYYVDNGPLVRTGPNGDIVVVAQGDIVRENANEGKKDTIYSRVSYFMPTNVERLVLTGTADIFAIGSAGDDILVGNSGNNLFRGGLGNDTLSGGGLIDSDTADYSDATSGLHITLGTNKTQDVGGGLGNDTLSSIENLTGGDFDDKLIGNNYANVLRGGKGADTLSGGAGLDTMFGGAGDDTYIVDNTGDKAREDTSLGHDDGGMDAVSSSVTFSIGSYIERLSLTGSAVIDGTGNGTDNTLLGNEAANILSGLAGRDVLYGKGGNDTLIGGLGRDTMTGGEGADTFAFASGDSVVDGKTYLCDTITDFVSGLDHIDLPIGIDVSHYAETSVAGSAYLTALNAAKSIMADGVHDTVFVAGPTDGWLFWNSAGDFAIPDDAVRLTGLNDITKFATTDLI